MKVSNSFFGTEFKVSSEKNPESKDREEIVNKYVVGDVLEAEIKEFSRQKDDLQTKKENLLTEESRYTKKISNLKSILNEKEKVLTEKQSFVNKYNEIVTLLTEIDVASKTIETNREQLLHSLQVLERTGKDKENALNDAKRNISELEKNLQMKLSEFTGDKDSCSRFATMIQDILQKRTRTAGTAVGNSSKSFDDEIQSIDMNIINVKDAISKLEIDIKEYNILL